MSSKFPPLDNLVESWLSLANSALPDAPVRKHAEPRTRGRIGRTRRSLVGR